MKKPPLDSKPNRGVFRANVFYLTLLQGGKYAFPLLTLPYLARVLGPDEYAIRAYTVSFMAVILAVIDFGFMQSGTRAIARYADEARRIGMINTAVYAGKGTMILAAALVTAVACFLSPILREDMLYVAVAFLATSIKALLPDFVFQGLQRMRNIAVRYILTQSVAVVLIFSLVKGSETLILVPISEGIASFLSMILAQRYLTKRLDIHFVRPKPRTIFQNLRESLPFFIATAASTLMANTITIAMGLFSLDNAVISYWSVSTTIVTGVQALWQPISRSLFPHMVKQRDMDLVKKLLIKGELVIIPLVALLVVLAPSIMRLVGGDGFDEGAYILRYSAITLPVTFYISLVGYPVLGALGHEKKLSLSIILSVVYQVVILSFCGFVSAFSIAVVIVVRLTSEVLLALLETMFVFRALRDSPLEEGGEFSIGS
jgi:PST family polysaccharide transporter